MSLPQTSCLCVPGWGENVAGVEVGALVAGTGADSIDNAEGVCSSPLGDYATINCSSSATSVTVSTDLDLNPTGIEYEGLVTVGLIGLRVTPATVDSVLRCAFTSGSRTWQSAAAIYGQEMTRTLPDGEEGHSLLGSGVANLIFHDLPTSAIAEGVEFEFDMDGNGSLASTQILVGSIFVGLQVPFANAPGVFNWSVEMVNQEHTTRGLGNISSDGVMRRSVSFEVSKANLEEITGIGAGFYGGGIGIAASVPNLFRAAMASLGQPCLLSPYPYPLESSWDASPDAGEITERLSSIRQNFFSIYGKLDRRSDISLREFNDGLSTEYRGRLRYSEFR